MSPTATRPGVAAPQRADPGRPSSPLVGIALLCTALVIFPGMDAIAKILALDLSPFQIGFLRFAVQTAFLALLLALMGRPLVGGLAPAELAKLALCGVLLGAGTSLFFWGLVYLPLANALAIFFVQPLVVTLLSATMLGEKVGRHRLGAVAVGLVGTLIVIRPSWSEFGIAAILPACAAVAQGLMLIIVRSITAHLDGLRVQFASGAFAGLFLAILVAAMTAADVPFATWRPVGTDLFGLVLAVGALATLCQFLVVQAVKRTPTSVLAPFQYLEIFSATALGFLVFGDFPDALTLLGTAIILAAGLYVFHRERRLARTSALTRAIAPDPGTAPAKEPA